jgi:hypothetical protein
MKTQSKELLTLCKAIGVSYTRAYNSFSVRDQTLRVKIYNVGSPTASQCRLLVGQAKVLGATKCGFIEVPDSIRFGQVGPSYSFVAVFPHPVEPKPVKLGKRPQLMSGQWH